MSIRRFAPRYSSSWNSQLVASLLALALSHLAQKPVELLLPDSNFDKGKREREDINFLVVVLSLHDLRSDVKRRPDHGHRPVLHSPGFSKVGNLHRVVLGDQAVVRF